MPAGIVPAVIGVGVLVIIAGSLDWLLKNPLILLLVAAVVGGGIFLWKKQQRARNRV